MVEFELALQALTRKKVDFVIVGGLAISAYSTGYITIDLDFCYSRTKENLSKIISSLAPFNPRFRGFTYGFTFCLGRKNLAKRNEFYVGNNDWRN